MWSISVKCGPFRVGGAHAEVHACQGNTQPIHKLYSKRVLLITFAASILHQQGLYKFHSNKQSFTQYSSSRFIQNNTKHSWVNNMLSAFIPFTHFTTSHTCLHGRLFNLINLRIAFCGQWQNKVGSLNTIMNLVQLILQLYNYFLNNQRCFTE